MFRYAALLCLLTFPPAPHQQMQVMVVLAWGSEWLKMNSDVFKRFMFKLLGAISRDGTSKLAGTSAREYTHNG